MFFPPSLVFFFPFSFASMVVDEDIQHVRCTSGYGYDFLVYPLSSIGLLWLMCTSIYLYICSVSCAVENVNEKSSRRRNSLTEWQTHSHTHAQSMPPSTIRQPETRAPIKISWSDIVLAERQSTLFARKNKQNRGKRMLFVSHCGDGGSSNVSSFYATQASRSKQIEYFRSAIVKSQRNGYSNVWLLPPGMSNAHYLLFVGRPFHRRISVRSFATANPHLTTKLMKFFEYSRLAATTVVKSISVRCLFSIRKHTRWSQ